MLVGCTDDDVITNGNDLQNGELENIPAYISVSFSGSSSSSRAEVNGDGHGTPEDSEHHNAGLEYESTIKDFALIIKGVTENGTNATNTGIAKIISVKDGAEIINSNNQNEPIYRFKEKFKVLAGEHKVLVIANPVEGIKNAITAANSSYTAIANLYDELKGGKISKYLSENVKDAARVNAVTGIQKPTSEDDQANTTAAFMMCNREEVTVKATIENTTAKPAQANIFLERVASKITFRTAKTNNIYDITFGLTVYGYKTFSVTRENTTNYYVIARDARGAEVAVLLKEKPKTKTIVEGEVTETYVSEITMATTDDIYSVYAYKKNDDGTYTLDTQLTPRQLNNDTSIPEDNIYYTDKKLGAWQPIPVLETLVDEVNDWSVQLTDYAITNMNNDVYVVRHTADANGENIAPWGYLDGENYIADPYFTDKNGSTPSAAGFTADTWFYNTLANVAKETEGTATTPSYFTSLESLGDMNVDDYEDNTHFDGEGEGKDNPGANMLYCFENTVKSTMQKHGLTTGIVFKAKVIPSKKDQEFAETLYQYDGNVYQSWEEVVKFYGPTNADIAGLTTEIAKLKENSTETTSEDILAAIRAAGISIYKNGECYYYTSQIKHFDNGDNDVPGIMEFAIVRNNIYSLAVSNIKSIGDAVVNPDPDVDNESEVGYIEVTANILPWIVRYNDIEF